MSRLTGYISLYGYKFTKEEHIDFIQLTWQLLTIPELEPKLCEVFVKSLLCLLEKRSLITPADLGESRLGVNIFIM